MLAHRPGDTAAHAAHAALCLPRSDLAVGLRETGDEFRGQPASTFPSVFPPKLPAVATRDSCRGSRTNLSCRWKLRKGVSGLYFWEELCGQIGGGWRSADGLLEPEAATGRGRPSLISPVALRDSKGCTFRWFPLPLFFFFFPQTRAKFFVKSNLWMFGKRNRAVHIRAARLNC